MHVILKKLKQQMEKWGWGGKSQYRKQSKTLKKKKKLLDILKER